MHDASMQDLTPRLFVDWRSMRIRLILLSLFLVCLMTNSHWIPLLTYKLPASIAESSSFAYFNSDGRTFYPLSDASFDAIAAEISQRLEQASPLRIPPYRFQVPMRCDICVDPTNWWGCSRTSMPIWSTGTI